jgi:hypothetical protein
MPIDRYRLCCIAVALLALSALLLANLATAAGPRRPPANVSSLLLQAAHAEDAKPPAAGNEDPDWKEIEQFIARNPGTLLGGVALPIILLLTILTRRRHYLWFSILIGAIAGAACETIPWVMTLTGSPIAARLMQAAVAALVALLCALWFDLVFFIGRLSRRLIQGRTLRGPDPVREWFRQAILVRWWAPSEQRAQDVDNAVTRWHVALVTGAGALVATVLIQGHFVAGMHEHFTATGFLTTTVILIAALYILEPVRERVLRLADREHHGEAVRDSLVRAVINSPGQGWLLSAFAVLGTLAVQVLIIGLEEAIHKAAPLELLQLAFSGLGPMPIAYFLCAALQSRVELKRAARGTSAFSALLVLTFFLMLAPVLSAFAGAMTAALVKTHLGSSFASFTIVPLIGIAAAFITCATAFWLSLGASLVIGFVFSGLAIWLMPVLWFRSRGKPPLLYLAIAILIATVVEGVVMAPLTFGVPRDPTNPRESIPALIGEPLITAIGWLIGLWLSGIDGVLETYQKVRPELFPNMKASPPQGSATEY